MSDFKVEKIMGDLKSKLQSQNKEDSITEKNVVEEAASRVKERIQIILNQGSIQSEKLRYLQSLNLESNKNSSQMIDDLINDDLHQANLSVDIQTQTKIDTSKPALVRPLVLKIHEILQNEIRSTLNPIVNNQIRYNTHSVLALNKIAESLKTAFDSLQLQITKLNICRVYNHFLEREPTRTEIDDWISFLTSRHLHDEDLVNMISSSNEAKQIQKIRLKSKGIQVEENDVAFKKIGDYIFYFDVNDRVLVEQFSKDEIYEKGTTEAIKKLIKSGKNVINVGANIGYYTVLIAQQSPNSKIFAFEPFPSNVKFLQKNIETNNCKNVEIISKAVSNKTGKTNLWLKDSGTQHFVSLKESSDFGKIEIETITIDDFISSKNMKIDFVLIDAEGSEKYILEGMEKTLQANPDLEIITEYNPYTLDIAGTSGMAFLDYIEKLGFLIYMIVDTDQQIKPMTKEQILRQITYPNVANLYLTRKTLII